MSMKSIELAEVKDIAEYESIREDFRRRIIDLKKRRRLAVGEILTFVFENRDTVLFQIQEMVRTERIVEEKKILEEIEIYNQMIPGKNSLSATMFIEIDDEARLREWLPLLVSIERDVGLTFPDASTARARYEEGRSTEDKTSTVHYLEIRLTGEQVRLFVDPKIDVWLVVSHANYQARAPVAGELRRSLIEDLVVE